jgi:tripartite-type tricarboxylate transporter receptor subunit TctC
MVVAKRNMGTRPKGGVFERSGEKSRKRGCWKLQCGGRPGNDNPVKEDAMKRYIASVAVLLCLTLIVCLFGTGETLAQSLGSKPIKLMVAAGPGGAEDLAARALAPLLQERLKTSVTVENNPGAGGKMAFEKLMKAEPDGHTLAVYTYPKSIIQEHIGKTNFRTMDFTPVYAWSTTWPVLVVNPESPFKTFDDFVKGAKAKPLAGGISNLGGQIHLLSLIFMDELGAKVNWVPYNSAAESLTAVAGKHLDFVIALTGSAAPLLDAGKVRPIILLGDQRDPFLPNVPAPKDLGFTFVSIPTSHCAMAPPKMAPAVLKILEAAFADACKDPIFLDFMQKRKMTVNPVTSEQLGKLTRELYPRIEKMAPALQAEVK